MNGDATAGARDTPADPVHDAGGHAAYRVFSRPEWGRLRANTPLTLSNADIARLRGVVDHLSLDEVADIVLPLSRLLNLQVTAARGLGVVQDTFLGRPVQPPPYIIGIAGSVAVGKSTFARVLQAVLSRWPDHPKVELVTTDGFLFPKSELEERRLMQRKGFPESYDLRRMISFLAAVKSVDAEAAAPIYSHLTYDIVPGQQQVIRRPDILIFEGLNVLQTSAGATLLASDFFDFSVYVDADEADIAAWYVRRFLLLQQTAFRQPGSYFDRYKDLPTSDATAVARQLWEQINLVNLRTNILPTRERARIVLHKRSDHRVDEIWLRRV
jgi:type I pantothenate kinase